MFIFTFFFHHFNKRDNFCYFMFASMDDEILPDWGFLLREFAPTGAIFFPQNWTLFSLETKMKMAEFVPLKVYPFSLFSVSEFA